MVRIKDTVALGVISAALTLWWAAPSARVGAAGGQIASVTGNPAPTPGQIHSLFIRLVENQHRNDAALQEFERVEHLVSRKSSDTSDGFTERTDRIIPSGTGTMKLEMSENGAHVSPDIYRHELEIALTALGIAAHPNDRYRQDLVKFEKRQHDRAELLDTALEGFRTTWAGRETRGSQTYSKYILDPNPDYKATTRLAASFEHIHAVMWIDESKAQFSRIEGDITSDITFGGGIVGKVYHGGHFVMEQSEVEPGVWLPTMYTYDVDGRKFMFGFGVHERTEISHYRRVWPPEHALELVRNELNNLSAQAPAR
jgi:hypothetical protein